jgi:chemotaxis signal transduction protein
MDFELIRDRIRDSLDPELGALDVAATEALLRERAARFAEVSRESSREQVYEVIDVERAGSRLGLPRERVREIRVVRLCRLPHLPPTLPGIFHIRGRVLPALDIQPLLDELTPLEHDARCMVAMLTDPRGELGLCIDDVHGLRPVYRDELDGSAELGCSEFFTVVTRDLLAIVNVASLLEHHEFTVSRINT